MLSFSLKLKTFGEIYLYVSPNGQFWNKEIKYQNILCQTARLIRIFKAELKENLILRQKYYHSTSPNIDNEINYIILKLNYITYYIRRNPFNKLQYIYIPFIVVSKITDVRFFRGRSISFFYIPLYRLYCWYIGVNEKMWYKI